MNNLNRVVLQGNLVRDVEVKYGSTSGKAFGSFCIAVNGSEKENGEWKESSAFVECKGFGASFEACVPHMKKGTSVIVDGKIKQKSWQAKDGQKKSSLIVSCDKIYPTWQKRDGSSQAPSAPQSDGFPEDFPL